MKEDMISHGDDLGYLFTPQALDGSPLSININETEEDKKVRDIFTNMIYSFVKFGKIQIENKTASHFTESANNYISVTSKPKMLNNFRFCQMGLWAGIAERLKTNTCRFLSVIGDGVQSVENVLFDTVNVKDNNPTKYVTDNTEKLTSTLKKPFNFNEDTVASMNPLSGKKKPDLIGIFG